jgi:hypothetical protein
MTDYNLPDVGSAEWYSTPLYPAVADIDSRVTRTEQRDLLDADSIAAASALATAAQDQATAALTAAQAAQALADGAIRTYYQADPPWPDGSPQPTSNVGDMWFKTVDNIVYRWEGTVWQLIRDPVITSALVAAQDAQTTADGKITAYYQPTQPWADADPLHDKDVGDLWYDTDDQNKPYYYDGTFWTEIRDGTIADAKTAADQKVTAYYQPTQPGVGKLGDVWYDTNNGNKPYLCTSPSAPGPVVYTLDPSWSAADLAKKSADGKNNIYRQPTQPTSGVLGDTWFNTDDGNKIYVHNGTTFVAVPLGPNAIADLAITNAKIANIDAAKMTIGKIQAEQLDASAIDGKTITGALFRTATTGQRVEIDSPAAANQIQFFTGDAAELAPGLLRVPKPTEGLPLGSISLTSPDLGLGTSPLVLWNDGAYLNFSGPSQVVLDGLKARMVYGPGDIFTPGDIQLDSAGVSIRTEGTGHNIEISSAGGITLAANNAITTNNGDVATTTATQALTNKNLNSTTNTFPPTLVTSVANNVKLQRGSGTFTTDAAGKFTIPHALGVKPTAVFATIQNSQYFAGPDIDNSTATAAIVYVRNLSVAGAPVAANTAVVCRYLIII